MSEEGVAYNSPAVAGKNTEPFLMERSEAIAAKVALQGAKGMLMELSGLVRPGRERTLVDLASRLVSDGISFLRDSNREGNGRQDDGGRRTEGARPNIRCTNCEHEFFSSARTNASCPECKKKVFIGNKSKIYSISPQ